LSLSEDPRAVEELKALGKENSWSARAEQILRAMEILGSRRRADQPRTTGFVLRAGRRLVKIWKVAGFLWIIKKLLSRLRGALSRIYSTGDRGKDLPLGMPLSEVYQIGLRQGKLGYSRGFFWRRILELLLQGTLVLAGMVFFAAGLTGRAGWFPGGPGMALGLGSILFAGGLLLLLLQGVPPWGFPRRVGLRFVEAAGYLRGQLENPAADLRQLQGTRGIYVILAGVPSYDSGGGSRPAQIALELLHQGYWVVYLHIFPSYEQEDSGARITHPNLFELPLKEFSWVEFQENFGPLIEEMTFTTLVEMPAVDLLPLLESLRRYGPVLYDLIDDWDTSLGGKWHSTIVEEEIIKRSDGLIGSAPVLVERLERVGNKDVLLLPNAVNSRLFDAARRYPRPGDVPQAERLILYVGALWGEWFDWDLLLEISAAYPKAAVVVIGDYNGQVEDPPGNLHFLGLKAQTSLPGYLDAADTAIIPWKTSAITSAASPLKMYEYLAMHVPVVAPDLELLQGIPGVWLAEDSRDFIKLLGIVEQESFPVQEVQAFLQENNWQARIRDLFSYERTLRSELEVEG